MPVCTLWAPRYCRLHASCTAYTYRNSNRGAEPPQPPACAPPRSKNPAPGALSRSPLLRTPTVCAAAVGRAPLGPPGPPGRVGTARTRVWCGLAYPADRRRFALRLGASRPAPASRPPRRPVLVRAPQGPGPARARAAVRRHAIHRSRPPSPSRRAGRAEPCRRSGVAHRGEEWPAWCSRGGRPGLPRGLPRGPLARVI